MESKAFMTFVYAIMIGVMCAVDYNAAAICLAIFFHAFYTTDKD